MTRIMTVLTVLALLAGAAAAQNAISVTKITLDGWQAEGDPQTWVGERLYDAIDGWADYHMGFEFRDAQSLRLKNGDRQLEVYVYRFATAPEAFGLYSVMRTRQDEILDIGGEASFNAQGKSYLWHGPFVVEFSTIGGEPLSRAEFRGIARTAAGQLQGDFEKPELLEFLPTEQRIEQSVLYFHYRQPLDRVLYLGAENILLIGDDLKKPAQVEAAYAQYEGAEPYSIVLLRYEQAKTAGDALRQVVARTAADEATVAEDGAWRIITDKRGKQTILWQQGGYLLVSAEARKPAGLKTIMTSVVKAVEASIAPAAAPFVPPPPVVVGGG